MAINFTVSYTFTPGTTISSSQVNTNFSDNAAVWQGLEAGTKSFAVLKVDGNPSTVLEVTPKQYVDRYAVWRRPNLQFSSVTTVAVESGLDGTAGNIPILFSDGSLRTETSTTRTSFVITRNAVLTTSGAQSGLRTGLSEATNTWYAMYAVKVTDSSTLWCTVGDTVLPVQGSYATLNSNFGTNGWVYLGLIKNGNDAGTGGDILTFLQAGSLTMFRNIGTGGNGLNSEGILMATSASAATVTYTYSAGTGSGTIPSIVTHGIWTPCTGSSTSLSVKNSGNNYFIARGLDAAAAGIAIRIPTAITTGLLVTGDAAKTYDIWLSGFVDGVLGVGSNPLL